MWQMSVLLLGLISTLTLESVQFPAVENGKDKELSVRQR